MKSPFLALCVISFSALFITAYEAILGFEDLLENSVRATAKRAHLARSNVANAFDASSNNRRISVSRSDVYSPSPSSASGAASSPDASRTLTGTGSGTTLTTVPVSVTTSVSGTITTAEMASSSSAAGSSSPSPSAAPSETRPAYWIDSKPISGDGGWKEAMAKAKDFVAQLTIDEKVNLTTGVDTVGRCVGNTGTIPRLGFAGFCLQDSPLGVRYTDYASVFPAAINIAATFDEGLMYARGAAMGREFRGKGVNVALGPMMNLGRNAAGGRNWEGAGPDPFLQAVHAVTTIKGIQDQGVIACAKHFALNEQEHYRGGGSGIASSSNIDDRTFHEVYLWPFAASVKAGVASVMCSYNRVNQTYACENRRLLNDIMKEELDFQGFMLSDWTATASLYDSVMNGLDVNMPGFREYGNPDQPNPSQANNSFWGVALGNAIRNGTIPMSRFDDMVTRLMAAFYKLGQHKKYPHVNFSYLTLSTTLNGQIVNEHVDVQQDHYKLIREIGSASTILLKNANQTLPLDFSSIKNLAIFGSDAGANPDGANSCADRGCDQGTLAVGWGSGTANFPYLITPAEAIKGYAREQQHRVVVQEVYNDYNYGSISSVAAQADTCIVFANANSGEGYITVDGNVGDRQNLTLWHAGEQLILTAAASCANTIVVLHTVGPVLIESWYDHANVTAILFAGLPGQESGNSILDILNGKTNPSARLPYTIAKKRSDYSSDILYSNVNETNPLIPQINYTDKLNIDYRHFDSAGIEPRHEFGFGLSYTSFHYSDLSVETLIDFKHPPIGHIEPGGKTGLWEAAVRVKFNVQNTGRYDGHEVAQLYLGFPGSAQEPPRILRGFGRKYIKRNRSTQFAMTLTVKDISIWDTPSQCWVIPSGQFTIYVGSSSRKLPLLGLFNCPS